MADLADTVRHLTELVVTNTAPPEALAGVTRQLRAAADALATHVPSQPVPRFVDPNEESRNRPSGATKPGSPPPPGSTDASTAGGEAATPTVTDDIPLSEMSMDAAMPYDPVIGRYNPLALPVHIWFEPPMAVGTACFTTPYEGGPGWVHGAAIAATFDIVLTAANHLAEAAGPTVWLTIRFRRPTLVGVEARFEAEVVANDGRRVTSRGRLVQDGMVCVEAEGEFAVLDPTRIRAVAERSNRRRGETRA
jgi:hypothetical protein